MNVRSKMLMALVAIVVSTLPHISYASQQDHGQQRDLLDHPNNNPSLSNQHLEQEKMEHFLSRESGKEDLSFLVKQNQMLLERLIKAEERLSLAESDINYLRMDHASLEARCSANEEDINITDSIFAKTDMNVNENMMSVK